MIHSDVVVRHTHKGLGLFASRPFQKGEILWITDDIDLKLPLAAYQRMEGLQKDKVNTYCYLDDQGRVVIPWDEGKYVNHSCSPNATSLLQFDNISVAIQDIDVGEELLEDYHSYSGHFESFRCACGAPACRGIVQCESSYNPNLRLDVNSIARHILSVPQQLLSIDTPETRALITILRQWASEETILPGSDRDSVHRALGTTMPHILSGKV